MKMHALLYVSGLPTKNWSTALTDAVFLHNHLVHSKTKKTPFEGYYGAKPDLSGLKHFGSRVCVKKTCKQCGKLDRHNFTGIFLGYLATKQKMIYINLTSGLIKTSHHAQFDKAWYLQPQRPPIVQLLHDLGLEYLKEESTTPLSLTTTPFCNVPLPPAALPPEEKPVWTLPPPCCFTSLPLRETALPQPITAAAACLTNGALHPHASPMADCPWEYRARLKISTASYQPPFDAIAAQIHMTTASDIVSEFLIDKLNMATVFMSRSPYFESFKEIRDLWKFDITKHRTAGLCLAHQNGCLFLGGMAPSTSGAEIPPWCTRIKGAWLIKLATNYSTLSIMYNGHSIPC